MFKESERATFVSYLPMQNMPYDCNGHLFQHF